MDDPEKYDIMYLESKIYNRHYSRVTFYNLWICVANSLDKSDKILDLGCGAGHLAHILYDMGFKNYTGIDFSGVAIKMAKIKVPTFIFLNDDISCIDYSDYTDFRFVSTETFEHLKDDIDLLKKLPKNNIVFSVPNFTAKLHYRTYKDEEFIKEYYKSVLNINNITPITLKKGRIMFVVEANIF